MSFLAPLIEIQELDLSADAERKRSLECPERGRVPELEAERVQIERRVVEAKAERAEIEAREEQLGAEVAKLVKELEAAEVERYSGKKKMDRDEAATHDEQQAARRTKQAELEEEEMTLLESIEEVEGRIAEQEDALAANQAEAAQALESIRKVEEDVAAAVERLGDKRSGLVTSIPDGVLETYGRLRANERNGGRGAAGLADGRCGACRIKLPSLERTRMMAEPEDALIQCPQCRRVLVRS